jgi:hypothetical protein
MSEKPLTRQVDLRHVAVFARSLIASLRAAAGGADLVKVLQGNVHAHCPQCQLQLFAEDVLALAATEAPDPKVSAKLHRLSQGFCGRQGCEALFYEFSFEAVEGVDWPKLLADLEATGGPQASETAVAEQDLAARQAARKRRTRQRVLIGLGLVVILLVVRHVMTGGTIPFLREARHFTADPASVPKLGQTNVVVTPDSGELRGGGRTQRRSGE